MFAGHGPGLSLAYLRQGGTFSCYPREQVLSPWQLSRFPQPICGRNGKTQPQGAVTPDRGSEGCSGNVVMTGLCEQLTAFLLPK